MTEPWGVEQITPRQSQALPSASSLHSPRRRRRRADWPAPPPTRLAGLGFGDGERRDERKTEKESRASHERP